MTVNLFKNLPALAGRGSNVNEENLRNKLFNCQHTEPIRNSFTKNFGVDFNGFNGSPDFGEVTFAQKPDNFAGGSIFHTVNKIIKDIRAARAATNQKPAAAFRHAINFTESVVLPKIFPNEIYYHCMFKNKSRIKRGRCRSGFGGFKLLLTTPVNYGGDSQNQQRDLHAESFYSRIKSDNIDCRNR